MLIPPIHLHLAAFMKLLLVGANLLHITSIFWLNPSHSLNTCVQSWWRPRVASWTSLLRLSRRFWIPIIGWLLRLEWIALSSIERPLFCWSWPWIQPSSPGLWSTSIWWLGFGLCLPASSRTQSARLPRRRRWSLHCSEGFDEQAAPSYSLLLLDWQWTALCMLGFAQWSWRHLCKRLWATHNSSGSPWMVPPGSSQQTRWRATNRTWKAQQVWSFVHRLPIRSTSSHFQSVRELMASADTGKERAGIGDC